VPGGRWDEEGGRSWDEMCGWWLPPRTGLLTLNTVTSCRFLISSTRASGFPLGTGMVPRTMVPGMDSVWRTAWVKGWLKSSIFPISSITHTLCRGPPPGPACRWQTVSGHLPRSLGHESHPTTHHSCEASHTSQVVPDGPADFSESARC
jgi:hypothetical protein